MSYSGGMNVSRRRDLDEADGKTRGLDRLWAGRVSIYREQSSI